MLNLFIRNSLTLLVICITLTSCVKKGDDQRKSILKDTPIGISYEQVLSFCKKSNLLCKQSRTAGFLNQDTGKTIGVMSIWAELSKKKISTYKVLTVEAYWGFGSDGRLIDIWVWKTIDAP